MKATHDTPCSSPKVALFLAEGFEEIEALAPLDYLRRADLEVVTFGVGAQRIKGSHGIVVEADQLLTKTALEGAFDAVVIPGGMPGAANIADSPTAIALISEVAAHGGLVGALCAAPAVVLGAKTTLLSGKHFTGFPGSESSVDPVLNPHAHCEVEASVVVDERLITARGVGVVNRFNEQLLMALVGEERAQEVLVRSQDSYSQVAAIVVKG